MTDQPQAAPEEWLAIDCPFCQVRLRIKAAHAHLRGRCPECGFRIRPLRPSGDPLSLPANQSEDAVGLVPEEEEWPEPAQVEKSDPAAEYSVASPPAVWPQEKPDLPSKAEVYTFGPGYLPEPEALPVQETEPPYAVGDDPLFAEDTASLPANTLAASSPTAPSPPLEPKPASEFHTYQLSESELRPRRPDPPARPLWDGVISFLWRPTSLTPLLLLVVGFGLLAMLAQVILDLYRAGMEGNRAALIGVGGFFLGFVWIAVWTGSYAAWGFLTIVQDTFAGNNEVSWPHFAWKEWLLPFVRLLAILVFLLVIPWRLCTWLGLEVAAVVLFGISLAVLPLALLSALATDMMWNWFSAKILNRLFRRPRALGALYGYWLLILAVILPLGYAALVRSKFWAAPLLGAAVAAGALLFARVLGRVGWVLSQVNLEPRTPKKPKTRGPRSATRQTSPKRSPA